MKRALPSGCNILDKEPTKEAIVKQVPYNKKKYRSVEGMLLRGTLALMFLEALLATAQNQICLILYTQS